MPRDRLLVHREAGQLRFSACTRSPRRASLYPYKPQPKKGVEGGEVRKLERVRGGWSDRILTSHVAYISEEAAGEAFAVWKHLMHFGDRLRVQVAWQNISAQPGGIGGSGGLCGRVAASAAQVGKSQSNAVVVLGTHLVFGVSPI